MDEPNQAPEMVRPIAAALPGAAKSSSRRRIPIFECVLTGIAFVGLRRLHLIAPLPIWVYLTLLGVSSALTTCLAYFAATKRQLRLAASVAATAVVAYATGWGPVLAIGFVYSINQEIEQSGSQVSQAALAWSLGGIACGQIGIALHLVPTLVRPPIVHGLALLGALGLWFTVRVVSAAIAANERSEARFRSLVQNASDVISVIGPDMRIRYISPAVEQLIGRPADDLIGELGGVFLHPDDREAMPELYRALLQHPGAVFRTQLRTVHDDGSWRWNDLSVVNLLEDASVGGIVATFHDLTQTKEAEERLAHQALHDSLTGLPNRALFLDRLEGALARGRRSSSSTAVLFLDVDRFKLINDSLGHQTGDQVLIVTAERLRQLVRPGDTVARLGGDEFVVCCEDVGAEAGAVEVACRILKDLERPLLVADREVWVKVSIGIAVARPAEERAPEAVLADADRALYMAKERGRARYEIFDDLCRHEARDRVQLENELRAALDRQELELFYQPEINLADGQLVGVEALLRWRHPGHGLVLPGEIIPIAEDNGLILPIGAWAIQQVCHQARQFQDQFGGAVPFSVNLSARQLAQPELVDIVVAALGQADLAPSLLCLEITESVLMDEGKTTIAVLERLRALGLRLGVDDFGTGYSSLVYLKRLPVDFLKIDRAFVDGLGKDAEDTAIVTAVLSLAKALGLAAVAEGVETHEQLAVLTQLGCETAQGYYWSRPIPSAEFAAWFERLSLGSSVPAPRDRHGAVSSGPAIATLNARAGLGAVGAGRAE